MKRLIHFIITFIFVTVFCLTSVSAVTIIPSNLDLMFSNGSARKLQDGDINALLKTAFELYRQKKFDEALANCTKAAKLSPNDFRPPYITGLVFMAQWKLKSASEEFAKSISLKSDYKQTYILKAKVDSLRGETEMALVESRKALELDPSFAEAYAMIGEILRFDKKRSDEAIKAFQAAIKANPQLLTVYEPFGQLLAETKDEKGAEEIFRKGMEIDPKHMAGRFTLGRLLVKQGRLKEARILWEGRASDTDKTYPNFITLLERAERMKQATDALAQKPDDPETLLQMGLAVMDGDHWVVDRRQERAIAYFRKVLELKPNFAMAQYAICKAYIQIADTFKDKNKNVDEELAKLKQLDPKLANEMEEYRKNYSGGLKGKPLKTDQ